MPPKRKTGGGGGRGKRPRQSSPDVAGSEEKILAGQQTEEKDAPMAPRMTKEDSNKMLPMDGGEADADGEADDDKMDGTHDVDAEGEREDAAHPKVEGQQLQDTSHEPVLEGDEDDIVRPVSSTRGRGRGRCRRTRGAASGSTRSSPRKAPQQAQAQAQAQQTSKPPNRRGRKAARGRGIVTSDPTNQEVETGVGEEDDAKSEENKGNDEDEDEEGGKEAKTEVANHPSLSQPIMAPQPHQEPQPSHEIHGADQSVHTPAEPFPQQPSAYYPNYPPQGPHFQYSYDAAPQPTVTPNAPDEQQYLALRPDEAQSVFPATSFATTVGTGTDSNSASSSFNVSYPPAAAAAAVHEHPLNVNAPQGDPFPPSAPMPVHYGNMYGVNASGDDEDEEDQDHEQSVGVHASSQKKKAQLAAAKGGGRTGRGDHVACHFCRGRKLKCDGRRPTCGHCAKRIHACEYDPNVRRRGPGRKEKNNRRDRNGSNNKRTGNVVVSGLNVNPQISTSSHPQMTAPSTEGFKRKRRHPSHTAVQGQASVLRFEGGDGTGVPGPAMKPVTAAYGVENNERLGFFYAGGGPAQFGPPYPPPYGTYGQAASAHHPHVQQASYGYAQDGREDGVADGGHADMDAEGEGDGDHEVYDSRHEGSSYDQPPNGNYSHAWPAEPPGGVPVSHPQHL